MQLIGQAYEKVNNGKGHEEAIHTVYVKNPDAVHSKVRLQQLERELQALKLANDTLNRQLKEEQRKNRQADEAEKRSADAAEQELNSLRRENRRLRKQVEEMRWELSSKVRAVTPLSSSDTSSSVLSPLRELPPKMLGPISALGRLNFRKLAVSLMLPMIIASLLMGLGREPWLALLAMFDEPQEESQARLTILDSNPADRVELQQEITEQPVQPAPEEPNPLQRIQLESVAGIWQLRYFENSETPYIGIRSEEGSYIIKACDGGFRYYRNSNLRATRLPPNLLFDQKERHFLIYNIPYGNGSFAANWAASKSLLINKEYFSNDGFSQAYERLQVACQF